MTMLRALKMEQFVIKKKKAKLKTNKQNALNVAVGVVCSERQLCKLVSLSQKIKAKTLSNFLAP